MSSAATEGRRVVREAVLSVERNEAEDTCASITPRGQEEPWVQYVPGRLNLFWPFREGAGAKLDPLGLSTAWTVEDFEREAFLTLNVDGPSEAVIDDIVALFRELYRVPADLPLEAEIYALMDEDLPERIPIERAPGSHTDAIGTYDGGLFMGFVVAAAPLGWCAVLHSFDADGAHVDSKIEVTGALADASALPRAEQRLNAWLAALPSRSPEDISVELFRVDHRGVAFGLVDASWEDDDGAIQLRVDLLPNGLSFHPPWDGSFDT